MGGSPSEHSGSGRSNPALGMDHQSGKFRTESHSDVFSFVGYKYHRDSALGKPTQERWLKPGFYPTPQVKTCFDCKMFDVAIWVVSLNGENGPRGMTSHEALSVSDQGAGKFPQPLDSLLPWTEAISAHLDWWQNPANVMKGSDLHPKDHSIQLLTDASNEGLGAHLEQNSTQGSWSLQEKGLHINVLELKAVFLALRHFKDQCQDQTVLVATDNSTVVAYINQQGGTHSAEMYTLLWRIMTWCHNLYITLKAWHIPGCLNVMSDLLSRSNQVQSTEWSLHSQVFKHIPTLVHSPRGPVYHSSEPQASTVHVSYPRPQGLGHRYSKHNLDRSHCLYVPSNGSPSQGDPEIRQCHCLIIVIAPGWPGMPWFWDLV